MSGPRALLTTTCFLLSVLCLGCEERRKQYVDNWHRLRKGMTHEEVRTLLGESSERCGPAEVDISTQPVADRIIGGLVMHMIFDTSYERWHYGDFEFMENLFRPSDKAWVVYFDRRGRVVKWRKPVSKPAGLPDFTRPHIEVATTWQLSPAESNAPYRAAVAVPPCVYALSRTGQLHVYDLPGPFTRAPDKPVTTIPRAGDGNDVEHIGDHLLFTDRGGLSVWSIADRRRPVRVTGKSVSDPFYSRSLVRDGNRLFTLGIGHIACFDVSDMSKPRLLFKDDSTHCWLSGCVIAGRLCAGESKVDMPQFGVSGPRDGVTVMAITPEGLREEAFVEIPSPYHLFQLDENHILACVDALSNFHSGFRPHGRSVIIDLTDPKHPIAGEILDETGGRAAAIADRPNGKLLLVPGAAFQIRQNRLTASQDLRMSGSTLDGCAYHARVTGRWVAFALDHSLVVLKISD